MAATRPAVIALTALAPVSWGSTYAVTTEFLPPDRPLFTGLMRALPAGLLLLALARVLPRGAWWGKAAVLGVLNIGAFFPLLFLAAYRMPGGMAAVVGSVGPLLVVGLSALLLGQRPTTRSVLTGAHGDRVGLAGGDVPDDLQDGGELLAGARHIGDPHRVPVHGAVVERRQGQRHRDVVDQHAALGVEQVQLDGVQGADGGEDVVQVVLHRPQPVRAGARGGVVVAGVTVRAAAQRPCISSAT